MEETVAASWANAEGSRKAVISSPLTNSLTGCNGSSPLAVPTFGDPVPEDGEAGTLPPSLAAVTGTTTVEMVDAGADGVVEEEMVVSSNQSLKGASPREEADTPATHRLQASHKIVIIAEQKQILKNKNLNLTYLTNRRTMAERKKGNRGYV